MRMARRLGDPMPDWDAVCAAYAASRRRARAASIEIEGERSASRKAAAASSVSRSREVGANFLVASSRSAAAA